MARSALADRRTQSQAQPTSDRSARGGRARIRRPRHPQAPQGNYARVISWVDKESGGIILAEGYDHANKLLKEFSIGKVTKVEGQWQLEEMEIRNVQTRSRTRLEFDFDPAR